MQLRALYFYNENTFSLRSQRKTFPLSLGYKYVFESDTYYNVCIYVKQSHNITVKQCRTS